MPEQKRRNALAIGLDPEEFGRVAPFLERDAFDVDRFPSGTGALELTAEVAIEVLLVRYPLPDLELDRFLAEIRDPESLCLSSPIVLLTTAERLAEAGAYIGRGANRVIDIETAESEIQDTISALLAVAPRKAARFLARLEIKLGGAKDMILCQTENLSDSGMLIRTERRYDIGTEIHFEFTLPNDVRPVAGVAQVVRHTMIGRDRVGGIAVRFLSFAGDSERRFESFLERL
jgi:Tfp pilus assembly protein PilZ/CheY-like chemotaxis protein